ncbi:MAG: phosphate acyltransferase PlsX [Clostridiales bacterium]|nr:phosphate acyltransferase PlsX [Clostridiales bacterium]
MKIYIDAMGGDNAPQATVAGALEALTLYPELTLELAGPIEEVKAVFTSTFADADAGVKNRVTIIDCPEIITNNESPVMAVRKKKQSAIVDGMLKLRDGQVDAFVSAGSTGAVLSGGMFRLGRINGIDRPALAPLLPNGKDFFLLIDCGANVDCRPEYLHQFAMMGSAYMEGMRGVKNPRVGLVNNGAEAEKGNELTKQAYPILAADKNLNFVGNVEAREITKDAADVIVCDGFVGNIILKFMEGVAGTLMSTIKKELLSDTKSKIGALLAKPAFKRVAKSMDHNEVGGAPLLGVRGNVVKAHGSSNSHAFACAIKQAVKMVEGDVVGKIEKLLVLPEADSVSE